LSIVLNDDPVSGRLHFGYTDHIRDDPRIANCQYPLDPYHPCTCDIHSAGQLLSGVWVRILEGLKDEHGEEEGLERARQLFVDWTLVTLGGEDACNGAYTATAMEVEQVVEEETRDPDWDIVCDAFAEHSIPCSE
jgi:hypothetical protein